MPPPPALLLMYFAAPLTPSAAPLNNPGARALSTSARTAMWISFAVTPISVAFGVSLDDCATGRRDSEHRDSGRAHADQQDPTLAEHPCLPSRPAGHRAVRHTVYTRSVQVASCLAAAA